MLPDLGQTGGPSLYRVVSLALRKLGRDDQSQPVMKERKLMPKKKTVVRNPWTKEDLRHLKAHSKASSPRPRRRRRREPRAFEPDVVGEIAELGEDVTLAWIQPVPEWLQSPERIAKSIAV